VIAEDTVTSGSSEIRAHLLKKNVLYDRILANKEAFIEYLEEKFPDFSKLKKPEFAASDFEIVFLYCSKNRLEERHKSLFPNVHFMEERHLQYFGALARTLGRSMRYELFKFFGLRIGDIGVGIGTPFKTYDGFVLPESPSGFPPGFKVGTFYVDPATLMSLGYVLRKDSWMDAEGLYQRMIKASKIRSMRQYLAQDERVFINNVIVSLPSSTQLRDSVAGAITPASITKTTAVTFAIPIEFNSVGIIDGQHRLFAYHEGNDQFDSKIAPKRIKQQLLVTGIIYPPDLAEEKQREFEAQLFLEINDKQTRTKAELRQAIESIVNPFSVISISSAVLNKLGANGPLCGVLEEHQFDRGKLKTSSIVSYAMRHIVKCEDDDTLFTLWSHPEKKALGIAIKAASTGKKKFPRPPRDVLENYISFCATEINNLLIGYKLAVPKHLWTLDRKISRALTTTAINGLIFALRRLLRERKTTTLDGYKRAFAKMKIDFTPGKFRYRSSHWRALGDKIVDQCF
jgi:DGQHR domain-containing protein